MKSVKKLLSLLLTLAMIIGVVAVIPATTVSAAAHETWYLTHNQTASPYLGTNITHTTSSHMLTVNSLANSKNSIWDNHFLLTNGSDNPLTPNTTYRIMFDVSAANKTIDLYTAKIGQYFYKTGSGAQVGLNMTTFTNLTAYAEQYEWGEYKKYHVAIDYTTPATLEGTAFGKNSYFDMAVTFTDVQNTPIYISNIRSVELAKYNIVDEGGTVLDTVSATYGDDVLTLVNSSEANKGGFEIVSVSPETIATDTTEIVVTQKKAEAEPIVVTFDSNYGTTNTSTHRYYETSDSGLLTIKNEAIALKDDNNVPNAGTAFGNRAFLLADDYAKGLEAGMSYKLQIQIRTFPQYVPLTQLSAEIKFGSGAWNVASDSPTITFTGEQLESMVTNNPTASANGGVTFEISTYVTVPASTGNNILLSIYGGSYTVPEVTIIPAADISVVDEAGNSLGTVAGLEGEKTADLITDSLKTDADCVYSTSPEVVEDILNPIVLTKTLKANIVEKILFNSDDYNGHGDTTTHYYSSKFYKDGGLKGVDVHKGATFGDRAVILANDRYESNIAAGNTYRVKFQLRTTATQLSNYKIDVAFSDTSVWNTGNAIAYTYSGAEIDSLVKSITTGNTYKYVIEIDVTVPDNANLKNVCLSVCGIDESETYWIDNAYIYSQSEAEIFTYNEEYYATVKGFEGDEIGEAISTDGMAKFINITNTFGSETVKVKSNSVIYHGDVNADGSINAADLTLFRRILLEVAEAHEYDEFGMNANPSTENGNDAVDIRDLVRLKKIVAGYYDDLNLPETLTYNDYELAWNYEFDGTSVDENVIGSISGIHEIEGLNYVTVGDKNCVNVANGILNISPKYNYGNMLASHAFSTQNTMNFAYGYFEIRAKLSYSAANLPAIWFKTDGGLSNKGDGDTLEYDLLETFGNTSLFKHNVHYWDTEGNTYNANNTANREYAFESVATAAQYHTYGFEWYYDEADACSYITLYVDGVKQGTLSANDINHKWYQDVPEDFDRPMYLILSNQIITQAYAEANSSWLAGRGATAEDFPMDMCVDYIRLYQSESNTGNVLVTK